MVFAHDDGSFMHTFLLREPGFDFAQLDAKAANLDLMVVATEIFEHPFRRPAAQITGLVQTRRRIIAEGIGQETLGGEVGAVEVAQANAVATDPELTSHTNRHGLHPGIEDMEPDVIDRPADGQGICTVCAVCTVLAAFLGTGILRQVPAVVGNDIGTFGGAVGVAQAGAAVGQALQPGAQFLQADGLATEDELAQAAQMSLRRGLA